MNFNPAILPWHQPAKQEVAHADGGGKAFIHLLVSDKGMYRKLFKSLKR
jgi:hypothetical protein